MNILTYTEDKFIRDLKKAGWVVKIPLAEYDVGISTKFKLVIYAESGMCALYKYLYNHNKPFRVGISIHFSPLTEIKKVCLSEKKLMKYSDENFVWFDLD